MRGVQYRRRKVRACAQFSLLAPNLRCSTETWENAAVLIDKPKGWTSFDVCAKLRGVLRTKKIGHAGTLDPMANGLLIVCTGRGTKWVDFYQAQVKGYTGCLRLGESTPSYDAETEARRCRKLLSFHRALLMQC